MFATPIGRFSYAHRNLAAYSSGIVLNQASEYQQFLIATPEKALVDLLIVRRGQITKISDLEETLLEDLRIEEEDLRKLDLRQIKKINECHPHTTTTNLIKVISKL